MDEVKVHHQEGVTVFMTKHVGGEQVDENVEQSLPNTESKEQILEWIKEYQETEVKRLKRILVLHYELDLVQSIARKYSNGKSYHEDIAQVGMLGLLGAIRRYDPEFGRNFEAFAVPTIIGEIKRFLRDKTWAVHVPQTYKRAWTTNTSQQLKH